MDQKDNKPSTPSRRSNKEESDSLEEEDLRTAAETESLTDARISRVPPPVTQSPRDAWANVAPSSQPRIVPAARLSQADREAAEIADSTKRALETLRSSSDPRNRLFVASQSPAGSAPQTTPKRAKSPFRSFSGHGRPLVTPCKGGAGGVQTAVAASPAQSSIRTAAALSPDVRTGVENSGRSKRLREYHQQQQSRPQSIERSARSEVSTAVSSRNAKSKTSKSKKGCRTVHSATANYEIDLRSRRDSGAGPTTNVSTARTISPSRSGRSPARPTAAAPVEPPAPFYDPDYPPLPSEGDPTEQVVDIIDKERAAQMYTPHISRPILFGMSGVRTATTISPARNNRTLAERTGRGSTASVNTSRSPATKSEKSLRTARSSKPTPSNSLGSYNTDHVSISSKRAASNSRSNHKSQLQCSLATTSARSFASNKTWATTPGHKNLRTAQKSVSATPVTATARSGSFSTDSSASRGPARSRNVITPLRTASKQSTRSTRSPAETTCVSPDVTSAQRTPMRTGRALIRPHTPATPAGWPYRASEQAQMQQTSIRVAPSSTSMKTGRASSPAKSTKSPLRSQKELHREAKSASRSGRRSNNPTSNVSTARTIASRAPSSSVATSSSSAKELHSSKTNSRTFSAAELKAANRGTVPANEGPDMVIETVQAHGNIEIDLCFNFRVRSPPGQGFGESRSPLKPKEVLINGKPIWKDQ